MTSRNVDTMRMKHIDVCFLRLQMMFEQGWPVMSQLHNLYISLKEGVDFRCSGCGSRGGAGRQVIGRLLVQIPGFLSTDPKYPAVLWFGLFNVWVRNSLTQLIVRFLWKHCITHDWIAPDEQGGTLHCPVCECMGYLETRPPGVCFF